MSIFHKFSNIFDYINSEEDFNGSEFYGSNDMLNVNYYDDCLIATNYDDDSVSELYYFIEANAVHIRNEDNFLLCELDGTKIVLFDNYDLLAIIINKKDKEQIENFI